MAMVQEATATATATSTDKTVHIFRFKVDDEIMKMIVGFAKLHQYDHRKDYKEAWNKWVESNMEILSAEEKRLKDLGYTGDVFDKFFKSGRYYFRKKSTLEKEQTERKQYIGLKKQTLKAMDTFIKEHLCERITPADSFVNFCNDELAIVSEEITTLVREYQMDVEEINAKLKKTYKNRYFRVSRQNGITQEE